MQKRAAGNPRIVGRSKREQQLTKEIGERMRQARNLAGLTIREISDQTGFSEKSISRWQEGYHEPGITTVIMWAEITGVTVAWLAGESKGDAPELPHDALEALLGHARQTQAVIERLIAEEG